MKQTLKLLLAERLILNGELDQAQKLLKTKGRKLGKNEKSKVLYLSAIILGKQWEFAKMEALLVQALELDPHNSRAIDKLAFCSEISTNPDKISETVELVIAENPYSHKAWYTGGVSFQMKGELEQAADYFEFSYICHPEFEPAYHKAIEVHLQVEDYQKTLGIIANYINRFQVSTAIILDWALCEEKTGKGNKALKLYKLAYELDPENPRVHFQLGSYYHEYESLKKAVPLFRKAHELAPDSEHILATLAKSYCHSEMYKKAIEHYQLLVNMAPEVEIYWEEFIEILLLKDQYRKALQEIEAAEAFHSNEKFDRYKLTCHSALQKKEKTLLTADH